MSANMSNQEQEETLWTPVATLAILKSLLEQMHVLGFTLEEVAYLGDNPLLLIEVKELITKSKAEAAAITAAQPHIPGG